MKTSVKNETADVSQSTEPIKIRLLIVQFDFELERREIPSFRAAVVEKVGRENVLFHNHGDDGFHYGYPAIQYKIYRGYPTLVCINEGAEEMLKFFQQSDWDMVINGRQVRTRIKHISLDYVYCGFSERPLYYRIRNWFALNEDNFRKFIGLNEDAARNELLERILVGNIISFAKCIRWDLDRRVVVAIPSQPKQRFFSFKNFQMMGFDLEFQANVVLPSAIGLGKSTSRGFGVIGKAVTR